MNLARLLSAAKPIQVTGPTDLEIRDLTYDSRKASHGVLFFALPGARTDGNRFVKEAIDKGAAAVVSEMPVPPPPFSLTQRGSTGKPATWIQVPDVLRSMSAVASAYYENSSRAMTVIGVTGTNGKTTTTYFLESILTTHGASSACGVIGTVNYRLGGRELEKAGNTTPLSIDLQRLLHRMRLHHATHAVMEVSSHALSLKRVEDVDFDAAVFTNLHRDHLDYHKTRERYFEAKARLFDLLCRTDNSKKRRLAAVNFDDEMSSQLRHRIIDADLWTFGLARAGGNSLDSPTGLRGAIVSTSPKATLFKMTHKDHEWIVQLRLIGEHNVYNALAAAAVALWLGIPPQTVIQGLQNLKLVPGRLEPVEAGQPFSVLVDYAHTDSALAQVLGLLKKLPHRRIITVFGCGGDRDSTKRGPMGIAACSLSDMAVVTSDNPRTEDPLAIIGRIEEGIKTNGHQNYKIIPDRKEAIVQAIRMAQEEDIVLIAGKGHETYQILSDRTIHFDDREIAREAISRLVHR